MSTKQTAAILGISFATLAMAALGIKFWNAHTTPASAPCINNLRQIEGAKDQWAIEQNKATNDVPQHSDVVIYLKNERMPICPEGGSYTVGSVGTEATCSIGGRAHTQSR